MKVKGEILLMSKNEIEWKVPDFFSLPGEYFYIFESPEFTCLQESWCLQCLPNGTRPRGINLYLKSKSKGKPGHTFACRMGIKQISGLEFVSRTYKRSVLDTCPEFLLVERDCLKNHKDTVAPTGELTFFCILGAETSKEAAHPEVKDVATETTEDYFGNLAEASDDGEEISSDLEDTDKLIQSIKSLLFTGEHHDTIVKVKDQEFQAHKLILVVRSVVFASMFRHDTIERQTKVITIEDCDPEAFRMFLAFLYSAKLENVTVENVINLFYIADKYQVNEVKSKCMKFMMKNMTVDTFCDFITLALTHSEKVLLERATEYFSKNAKKIVVTVKWVSFLKTHPIESNELYFKALMYVDPDSSI